MNRDDPEFAKAYDEVGSLTLDGVRRLQAFTSVRLSSLRPTSAEAAFLGDIALALHDLAQRLRKEAEPPAAAGVQTVDPTEL